MKNEIEQIAQQNDMSIEFVTWFFNEKKVGCGNVWFMMMAAMWEGWKGRSIEMDKLAAENVALRNSSSHALQTGEPPKIYREEWFIARVKGRGFAVLRSLPEEYSHDYTTLDATYFRKDLILEWMQLPNSEFLPNVKTPATDMFISSLSSEISK